MFLVAALARSPHAPSARHLLLAKQNPRYVTKTTHYHILFQKDYTITSQSMHAANDSDWAVCSETRCSTLGAFFAFNRSPMFGGQNYN